MAQAVVRADTLLNSDDTPVVRRWQVGVGVLCAVVAGLFSLRVALHQYGPTVHPDEWGFLLNGQAIIGHTEVQVPTGSFYPAGFGVVTGVLALLTGSITGEYRATLVLNFFLCLAVAFLAHRVSRRVLGLSGRMAVLAASLAFVGPGTVVSSLFAWPETAARVAFLAFVLGFHRIAQTKSHLQILLFGFLVGLMPVLHGRFTLVLALACAVILWWAWLREIPRVVAVASCGLASGSYLAGRLLNAFVKRTLYADAWDQENRLLRRIVNPTLWPALARTTTGQWWYLLVTSCGLFMVAAFFVWRTVRRGTFASLARDPRRLTVAVIGASVLLVVFTGALQLLYGNRGDHLIYGRYVEILVPVVLVTGCAAFESAPLLARRAFAVSAAAVPTIAVLYVLVDLGDGVKGGWVRRSIVYPNIVGLDALKYVVQPGLLTWGAVACVVTLVVWWLSRARDGRAVLAVVAILATSSVWTITHSIPSRTRDLRSSTVIPAYLRKDGTTSIGYDGEILNDAYYYYIRYKLHPLKITSVYASGPPGTSRGVGTDIPADISCIVGFADRPPREGPWRIVADERTMYRVLWQRVGTDHC